MTAASQVPKAKPVPPAPQDQRPREPSMEDILASIRRIIADDQLQAGRAGLGSLKRMSAPALPAAPEPQPEERVDAQPESMAPADAYDDILDLARMPETVVPEPAASTPLSSAETYSLTATTREDVYNEEPQELVPDHGAADHYMNGHATSAPAGSEPAAQLRGPVAEAGASSQSYVAPSQPAAALASKTQPDHADSLLSPALGASVMSSFETLAASVVLQNDAMLERIMHDAMRPLIKTWLEENLPTIVERLVRAEIERVARGGRA